MVITKGCEFHSPNEPGEAYQVDGRNASCTFVANFDADTEVWKREVSDLNGMNTRRLRPIRTINGVIQWMRDNDCTEILVMVTYDAAIT